MNKKSIQIPYDLFVALVGYHLACKDDYAKEIHQRLEQRLDAMVRHELYAKYKTAPPQKKQEQARQEYIDKLEVRCFREVPYQPIYAPHTPKQGAGYRLKSVRRTSSHRMIFCGQRGFGGGPQQAGGKKCECVLTRALLARF